MKTISDLIIAVAYSETVQILHLSGPLKEKVDEDPNFEHQISYYRKTYPSVCRFRIPATRDVHYSSAILEIS